MNLIILVKIKGINLFYFIDPAFRTRNNKNILKQLSFVLNYIRIYFLVKKYDLCTKIYSLNSTVYQYLISILTYLPQDLFILFCVTLGFTIMLCYILTSETYILVSCGEKSQVLNITLLQINLLLYCQY